MVTGFFFLVSLIAVLLMMRWVGRVEKSADPAKAMHEGIFGIREDDKPKVAPKPSVRAPWEARSIRNEQDGR